MRQWLGVLILPAAVAAGVVLAAVLPNSRRAETFGGSWVRVVLWVKPSGEIYGEPWKNFTTKEECAQSIKFPLESGKLLFMQGCLRRDEMSNFRALNFTLEPAKPEGRDL